MTYGARSVFLYLLIGFLNGCVAGQTLWAEGLTSENFAPTDETELIKELYSFEEMFRGLNTASRKRIFQDLNNSVTEQSPIKQRLKLAILLSVMATERTDFGRARKLYKDCLAEVSTPLLAGYIRASLNTLKRIESDETNNQTVRRELIAERGRSKRLQSQIEVLMRNITEKDSKLELLEIELAEKEKHIETLKAKIEALTFIEQSLKNREQVPESENLDAKRRASSKATEDSLSEP